VLLYWIYPKIPSDQVQLSSPALISSAHQGFPPFHSLPCSLTLILPLAFDCHPLANTDHTIGLNRICQFKFTPFSPSLVLQNTSPLNGPSASALPRLFAPIYLCAHMRVCVIMTECFSERNKKYWSLAMTRPHSLGFVKLL